MASIVVVSGYTRLSFINYVPNGLMGLILLFYDEALIYKQICCCNDPMTLLQYTQFIRGSMSTLQEHDIQPTIKSIMHFGVIPQLVKFLQFEYLHHLQYEVSWILGSIISTTPQNITTIINSEAVPLLTKLLSSKSVDIQKQAMMALGNIANSTHHDVVLSHDVLSLLLPLYQTNPSSQRQITFSRNVTRILSQLCRGLPHIEWEYASIALQALAIMIKSDDEQILRCACRAYSYLTDQQFNEQIFDMIRISGALQRLIDLLQNESSTPRVPTLRAIRNILCGQHVQERVKGVIEYDEIEALRSKVAREQMYHQIPQFVKGCYSDHPATQFECTQTIRKLLSLESSPPINAVIESGVVPRLIQFLQMDNMPRLQFEAAWALENIANGTAENTAVLIQHGAVPLFVKLLSSPNDEVKEQAIWALGNIAGDSPECRNLVLSHGALTALLPLLHTNPRSEQETALLRNATWTLSNLCRGKPQPEWKYVKIALQALAIMITSDDNEILQDACWAYSYLSDCEFNFENKQINAIRCSGGLQKLIELLRHPSPHVRHPALRTIGNIVTGDDTQTQYVINAGVLKRMSTLLVSDRAPIRREACWTISNITAGDKDQIEAVISEGLMPELINIIKNDEYQISKEALWALGNAISGGTDQQIMYLVNLNVIQTFVEFIKTAMDDKGLLVALESIENILKVGQTINENGFNQFAKYFEECDGIDELQNIQRNEKTGDKVCKKAAQIIMDYFRGPPEEVSKVTSKV